MEAPKVNILIVDDHPKGLMALEAVLNDPSYQLIKASSGEEALKQLLHHEFALILMDVQMPELDGFETAAIIRAREKTKDIPIIFITSISKEDHYVQQGYASGAVDYLFKPFDPTVLRSKVNVFVDIFLKAKEIKRQQELLKEAEIQKRERALLLLEHQTSQRYMNLANAIPIIVWRGKQAGKWDYFNQTWYTFTGATPAESEGTLWTQFVHPEDLNRFQSFLETSPCCFVVECQIRSPSGYRWHLIRVGPEEGPPDSAQFFIGTATDIDDQKKTELKLQEAIRSRDEFLSIASHELKTPLTALKLQLQLFSKRVKTKDVPTQKLEEMLGRLESQVNRITVLVNQLLNVAYTRAGQSPYTFEIINFGKLVLSVVDRFSEQFRLSGSVLNLQISDTVSVRADSSKLDQVLENLISNAIKYGQGKPIQLILEERPNCVQFTIRDQGMGIKAEDQERIFRRFERAVSSNHISGLGLGLYIVSQIIECHSGKLKVESEPGKGASFIVELPLSPKSG